MGREIERKFLVAGDDWRAGARGVACRQGYLSTDRERVVRVRIMGGRAFLTVKGPASGPSRPEFEYEVPGDDAEQMLALCRGPLIEKTRFRIPGGNELVWEVDEFHGANAGLVVAEIELTAPDQPVALPPWVGAEVTGDPRYQNSNLTDHPYSTW